MNMTCDIIRDLLPLYHDGVCSADSAFAVEEHIAGCEACREELTRMDDPVAAPRPEENGGLRAVKRAWTRAQKRSFRKGLGIAGGVFLGIALLIGIFLCFFSVETMIGFSMEPTLDHGDRCVFSRFTQPDRGDIAAVPLDSIDIVHFIDIVRVAAIPGDTVEIRDGTLYVNGEASGLFPAGVLYPGDRSYPVTLEDDEYFVLGDNHDNSYDSRYETYGLVDRADIIGVYIGILPRLANPFVRAAAAKAN